MDKPPKLMKPASVLKSSKKSSSETVTKKELRKKIDFTQWLNDSIDDNKKEAVHSNISRLEKEFQGLASEIVVALTEQFSKPTSKFKIERLPLNYLKSFENKINNPYFLVTILFHQSTELSRQNEILKKLTHMTLNEEIVEYFYKKIENFGGSIGFDALWNRILESNLIQHEIWKLHQLRLLSVGMSYQVKIKQPLEVFGGLEFARAEFQELDKSRQMKIFRNLFECDIYSFVVFSFTIYGDSLAEKDFNEVVSETSDEVLFTFFDNRNKFSGSRLENFERKFITPLLKSRIDKIMNFESLLPFVLRRPQFSGLITDDTLIRAVSRALKSTDDLAGVFADKRVQDLSDTVTELELENRKIKDELLSVFAANEALRARENDLEKAIFNYENLLRSQIKMENSESEVMTLNAKIELVRDFVTNFDHLLDDSNGHQLEKSLQKLGISRVGFAGEKFAWNSELCESLTGLEIQEGTVVKSGYSWLHEDKKIVLRRVTLR